MNDILFFNWANQPWRGKADTAWQIPGNCYASSTYPMLQDGPPLAARPRRMCFINQVGRHNPLASKEADGTTALQLYAIALNHPVHDSNPEACPSFAVIAEVEITRPLKDIDNPWYWLTGADMDRLFAIPFQGGIKFGVRHRSVDGTSAPVWYASRLLIDN